MRKRVPLWWSAARGYHVDLPSYDTVDGTFEPITPGVIDANGVLLEVYNDSAGTAHSRPYDPAKVLALAPSVELELPDEWFDEKGEFIGTAALREMYIEHMRFGDEFYVPPVLSAP